MKNILILLLTFIFYTSCFSQNKFINNIENGYEIKGEIKGLKDSSVILAYYFGGKQFATDTAEVINEKFSFKGDEKLKGGMYLVVLGNQQYFDIIISEQYF